MRLIHRFHTPDDYYELNRSNDILRALTPLAVHKRDPR